MSRAEWINEEMEAEFLAAGNSAFRVFSSETAWIEKFADSYLISARRSSDFADLLRQLEAIAENRRWQMNACYGRLLTPSPREDDAPKILYRGVSEPVPEFQVREWNLLYRIDLRSGYSSGLFMDQRENRRALLLDPPRRLLNCFAFTCAFSVAAASVGAETLSLDLSKRYLDIGKANFEGNKLPTDGHRWIADDVFAVLPRLARRGEEFDVIILDPPTFSRGAKKKIFRVEDHFAELLSLALPCAGRGAKILLSTNHSVWKSGHLRQLALAGCRAAGRKVSVREGGIPPDIRPEHAASTLWLFLD